MRPGIDNERRQFLRTAAMTIGSARAGLFGRLRAAGASASSAAALAESSVVEANQRAARELAAIGKAAEWINSPRLVPSTVSGKVVLVDFWTYTCINWLRTLPYVRAWAQKYRQGLVVIGVHTPEFPFEHNIENVRRAVQQMRIEYPIVIDNDYSIWRAFDNQYWPALYLLDSRGRVQQHQFGEGEYQTSERAMQRLLKEAGFNGGGDGIVSVDGSGFEAAADWTNLKSPESYLGYARMQNFASPDAAKFDQVRTYRAPSRLALNRWSVAGDWTIGRQATVLNKTPGQILYRFHARDVHLVMGPSSPAKPIRFRVSLDGQPPGAAHGLDVDEGGNGTVSEQRLYQLVRQPKPIVDRQFAIEFLDPAVEAFSFTFG
jgi:thiol-disulfide isomerase/thioredoxin